MTAPRRITTAAQLLALIEEEQLVTLTRTGDLPSLVEAVAGGPVKGSWWSHPAGKRIFALASALDDDARGEVLACKLVAGKVTFVHRALWPALLCAVTDGPWRERRRRALDAAGRRLLDDVERAGELRATGAKAPREQLERTLLVWSRSEHTEKGRHETILSTWTRWASAAVVRAAARLEVGAARAAIARAARGQPTPFTDDSDEGNQGTL